MHIERLDEIDAGALQRLLTDLGAREQVASVLLLLAEDGRPAPEQWPEIVAPAGVPVVGGVFPRVLIGDEALERGAVAVGLPVAIHATVIPEVSEEVEAFEARVADAFETLDPQGQTVLVLFDATSSHVDALLSALFEQVGLLGTYLGGGAGSLSFERVPCVLTPHGMLEDAALIALIDLPSVVGVMHGWKAISLPLQVTASHGRVIESLDHRPAAQVYESLVESHSGQRFGDDFFALARSYPLGIMQLDGEVVVRDPVVRDGDDLLCVGEVPVGAYVQLLYGDEESLLEAADRAGDLARAGSVPPAVSDASGEPVVGLVLDCISRVLYLGDRFGEELDRLDLGVPRVGAATIGEVCNPGDRYLELYNKTVVAARLGASAG